MNKPLTYLLSLTFLFLFSGSVYGEESEVKKKYWKNGKLKSETHYKNAEEEGLSTRWHKNGNKQLETHYKNGKKEGHETYSYITVEKKTQNNIKNVEESIIKHWFVRGFL